MYSFIKSKNLFFIALYSIFVLLFGTVTGSIVYSFFRGYPSGTIILKHNNFQIASNYFEDFLKKSRFENGRRWELFADSVKVKTDINKGSIYNVTCCFYDGKQEKAVIESQELEVDFIKEEAVFKFNVRAVSAKGEIFNVDKLIWSNKSGKAYGEGNVTLLKKDSIIKADKIDADIMFSNYNMSGRVEIIKINQRKKVIAPCSGINRVKKG